MIHRVWKWSENAQSCQNVLRDAKEQFHWETPQPQQWNCGEIGKCRGFKNGRKKQTACSQAPTRSHWASHGWDRRLYVWKRRKRVFLSPVLPHDQNRPIRKLKDVCISSLRVKVKLTASWARVLRDGIIESVSPRLNSATLSFLSTVLALIPLVALCQCPVRLRISVSWVQRLLCYCKAWLRLTETKRIGEHEKTTTDRMMRPSKTKLTYTFESLNEN